MLVYQYKIIIGLVVLLTIVICLQVIIITRGCAAPSHRDRLLRMSNVIDCWIPASDASCIYKKQLIRDMDWMLAEYDASWNWNDWE